VHVKKLTWGNHRMPVFSLAAKGRVVAEKRLLYLRLKVRFLDDWTLCILYQIMVCLVFVEIFMCHLIDDHSELRAINKVCIWRIFLWVLVCLCVVMMTCRISIFLITVNNLVQYITCLCCAGYRYLHMIEDMLFL
jgi:hypothetical protein